MPAGVTLKLNRAFVDALNSPEPKTGPTAFLAASMASTPEQFGAFVKARPANYQKVVKASGADIEWRRRAILNLVPCAE